MTFHRVQTLVIGLCAPRTSIVWHRAEGGVWRPWRAAHEDQHNLPDLLSLTTSNAS
jgi:hypothetical protein